MLSFLTFNRMIYFGILCFIFILNGCAPKQINLKMNIPYLNIKQQRLKAGLVLPDPEKMKDKLYNDFCFGNFKISYSDEVRESAVQACSQIFESVTVINNIEANIGSYDIFIQLSDPKLKFESHCAGATTAAIALGVLGASLSKVSFDVEAILHSEISDKNGKTLFFDDHRAMTTESFNAMSESRPIIGQAVSDVLTSTFREFSLSLLNSEGYKTYAQSITHSNDLKMMPYVKDDLLAKDQRMEKKNMVEIRKITHQDGFAVVIGVSEYKYKNERELTNLIYADDDAKNFALMLQKLGWPKSRIKLLLNDEANKRNIEIVLESWLTKAGPNDQIVLFWAGHGYSDPEDPEKIYFACHDTDIKIPATGYRMDKVRIALEERKSKNVVVLADTCHAGKLITRGVRGISIAPIIDKMNREQNVPKGWIFMVGADTDRQAIEHTSWTNGAFTHSLIKGLSGEADGFQSAGAKDGVVTMGELKDYLHTAMPDETQKVLGVAKRPIITTSTGDPDIWNLTLQAE